MSSKKLIDIHIFYFVRTEQERRDILLFLQKLEQEVSAAAVSIACEFHFANNKKDALGVCSL